MISALPGGGLRVRPRFVRVLHSLFDYPNLLGTYYVEKFLEYAGYKDYASIRPAVLLMMTDPDPKIAIAGARKACFHGFDDAAEGDNAAYARSGSAIPFACPFLVIRQLVLNDCNLAILYSHFDNRIDQPMFPNVI